MKYTGRSGPKIEPCGILNVTREIRTTFYQFKETESLYKFILLVSTLILIFFMNFSDSCHFDTIFKRIEKRYTSQKNYSIEKKELEESSLTNNIKRKYKQCAAKCK